MLAYGWYEIEALGDLTAEMEARGVNWDQGKEGSRRGAETRRKEK